MLTQNAQTRFHRKITYAMLYWSACDNTAHEYYQCNVDSKPKNSFASLPKSALHIEITYVMFGHGNRQLLWGK